jgi:hypothetical protein
MHCFFVQRRQIKLKWIEQAKNKCGSQLLKMDICASLIQCTLLIIKEGSLSSYVRKLGKETRDTLTVNEAMFSLLL